MLSIINKLTERKTRKRLDKLSDELNVTLVLIMYRLGLDITLADGKILSITNPYNKDSHEEKFAQRLYRAYR